MSQAPIVRDMGYLLTFGRADVLLVFTFVMSTDLVLDITVPANVSLVCLVLFISEDFQPANLI